MPKQIIIPEEEYVKEVEQKFAEGINLGRNQIIGVVHAILSGKIDSVELTGNIEPHIRSFVDRAAQYVEKHGPAEEVVSETEEQEVAVEAGRNDKKKPASPQSGTKSSNSGSGSGANSSKNERTAKQKS